VFDKTGTLTIGNPQIIKIIPFESYNINELISLAASIEIGSNHPLAHAIVDYGLENGVKLEEVNKFQEITGHGVQGLIQDDLIIVGNSRLMKQNNIDSPDLFMHINELENQGLTVVSVAKNGKSIGLIAIGDSLKRDARETIEILYKMGLDPIMITGDNQNVAEAIARKLGIKEFYAEVLPQDKSAKIRELQSKGYKVAMVGDGINDAPALARATVGISMGTIGSDTAVDASDIVLLRDELPLLEWLTHKARKTVSIVKQNISLSLFVILFATTPALLGLVPLFVAVLLHEGGTVIVGLNSLRLLKK
ncbi:MAG: cation-translocating P-type ATPase, partial [Simkaniaceae bacterium]|nr:cation-translocating P-type ATPase [Simkaniaceae bacterium]